MDNEQRIERREMAFFHYSQNNSGGSFDWSDGVGHHVVIEAPNAAMADAKLETVGGYFDGCDDGRDCSCCGDRWSRAWKAGDAEPMVYGSPAAEHCDDKTMTWGRGPEQAEVIVHYLDGRVQKYFSNRAA